MLLFTLTVFNKIQQEIKQEKLNYDEISFPQPNETFLSHLNENELYNPALIEDLSSNKTVFEFFFMNERL